jgi:hypothetical protein
VRELYDAEPGGYCKVVETDADGKAIRDVWWIKDPHGSMGRLATHTVTEHEDGTITVDPSILDPDPGGYHGWLKRGVWSDG